MQYLELMKIKGVPLRIHRSWVFILFLFTWSSQSQLSNLFEAQIPLLVRWGVGFISSLLVFGSVLLHEIGHSLMALHEGVKIRSITLFLLGGVATTEKECETPIAALRIAIAGPLVSFFLAFCLHIRRKSRQILFTKPNRHCNHHPFCLESFWLK